MQDEKNKLPELIKRLLDDGGNSDAIEIAVSLGYTEEEARKKVPYMLIKFAQYSKEKAQEASKIMSRTDVKEKISSVLQAVGEKITSMLETKGDISEELAKALTVFNNTFDRYTKFEGLNKAEKIDLTVSDYDISRLTNPEDKIKFLEYLEIVRKENND